MKYIYTVVESSNLLRADRLDPILKKAAWKASDSAPSYVEGTDRLNWYKKSLGIDNINRGASATSYMVMAYGIMVKGVKDGPLAEYSGIPLKQLYSPTLDDSLVAEFMEALGTNDENKAVEWARWGIPLDVIQPWMKEGRHAYTVISPMDSGASPEFYSFWKQYEHAQKKSEVRKLTRGTYNNGVNPVTGHLHSLSKLDMPRKEAAEWLIDGWHVDAIRGFHSAGISFKEAGKFYEDGLQSYEGIMFAHENPDTPVDYVKSFFK